MIETLVTIIHILTCLALILAILLQSGKGGGVSAAFGGGAGQALGQRGATTVLGRFTGIASATFMITSMILAVYSTSEYRDETLRDIPAAEETDTKKEAAKGKKAKTASDAKDSGKTAGDSAAKDKAAGDKPAPKADAPKSDTPKADAPKSDAPKADAPKADAPKADAPKADPKPANP